MNVLVTGHTGFIASAFIQSYNHKYQVNGVSLSKTPLEKINFSSIDCVLHTSGVVHDNTGIPAEVYFDVNVKRTLQLAQTAKAAGVKHFIFMSSSLVYGVSDNDAENCALTETSPCHPSTPYGQSKLQAEQELQKMEDSHFTVSIIRSPMVYGENCKGNMLSLVRLVEKVPVTPFKGENNLRSFAYIGNLIHFLDLVVQKKPSGVFIPQDEKPISLESLMMMIINALEKKRWFIAIPSFLKILLSRLRPHLVKKLFFNFYFDSKKSNETLGYHPPFASQAGIKKMIDSRS